MDSIGPFLLRGKVDPDISGAMDSLSQASYILPSIVTVNCTASGRVRLVFP